jgi:hypothetical protein
LDVRVLGCDQLMYHLLRRCAAVTQALSRTRRHHYRRRTCRNPLKSRCLTSHCSAGNCSHLALYLVLAEAANDL